MTDPQYLAQMYGKANKGKINPSIIETLNQIGTRAGGTAAEEPALKINDVLKTAKNTINNEGGFVGDKKAQQKILDILKNEQEQISNGYNEVINNPLKGDRIGKDDILATLKPSELKTYVINRGAAIKDPKTGDIIVQGDALKKATGTNGNFGFSKMIFKHGITPNDAQKVPSIIREYEPYDATFGKEKYRIKLNDKENLLIVFKNTGDNNRLITTYKEDILPNAKYSKKKSLNADANFRGIAPTTSKAVAATDNASQGLTNSIQEKKPFVKGAKNPKINDILKEIK